MNLTKRLTLVLGLAAGVSIGSHAVSIAEAYENAGLSQVYLRWTETNNPASARYTVTRQAYKDNGEPKGGPVTLAENLCRLQWIDTGVLAGKYTYTITSSTSGTVQTSTISVSERDWNKNLYSLDVVYETTPNELMAEWKSMGNVGWDEAASSTDVYGTKGQFLHTEWFGNTDHDNTTRTSHQWMSSTYWGSVPPAAKKDANGQNNGQVLDGNRYIWLDQMDNFSEGSENGAACYPWAARGMSWRAHAGGFKKSERCWYIPIREKASDQIHGIICVWDPDRKTSTLPGSRTLSDNDGRPYNGAPFLINLQIAREKLGSNYSNNDQFFSLAMSDNGRSYILRQGNTAYDTKPAENQESYWIYPTDVTGSSHRWTPTKNSLTKYDFTGTYMQSQRLPGSACKLINVKGNMVNGQEEWNYAPTNYNKMNEAYMYMVPDYNNAATTLRVRSEKIVNQAYKGYTRFDISGLPSFAGTGKVADYNYVIPVEGSNRKDFLVQIKSNYMVYVYNSVAQSAQYGEGDSQLTSVTNSEYKVINLGKDFSPIVGGCSFVYKGETFLVLPSARYDEKNYGDFTVFKVEGMDASFKLVPIIDYKVTKDVYNANVKRTFFDAEVYENDGFVWICRYLPGRRLDKYRLSMPPVHDAQPAVNHTFVRSKLPENQSYRQYRLAGGEQLNGLKPNYDRVTHVNTNFVWTNAGYNKWNNSTAHNSDWMLDGIDAKAYYSNGQNPNHSGYRELHNDFKTDGSSNIWNPWGNENYGRDHEFSIHVQPVLVRRHNGFTERVVGKKSYAKNTPNYGPNHPGVTVKVLEGTGIAQGQYRVDLNFTAAAHAWCAAANDNVPVDYYEIYYNNTRVTGFNTVVGDQNRYYLYNGKTSSHVRTANIPENAKINYLTNQDKVWGDYNFDAWPAPVYEKGNTINPDKSVVMFYTTDPAVKTATFYVRPHYSTDGDNSGTDRRELHVVGEGRATPTYGGTTGVDDIVADDEGTVEWFTLQGIRVSEEKLTPGVYIRRSAKGASKVYVR